MGIADAKTLREISGKKNPFRVVDGARAVVVFAIPLVSSTIIGAPDEKYNRLVELHYQKLRELAYDIATFLEGRGFEAHPCHDQRDVEHKRAAELAGLGRVGDHTLLITPTYGCRVHLNSVVTDAPLEADRKIDEELCDHCGECLRKCPARAIQPGIKVDIQSCLDYRRKILKRAYCGICMKTCWNHLRQTL